MAPGLLLGLTGLSGGLEALGTRAAVDAIADAEGHGLHAVWVNEEHLDQRRRSGAASSTLIFLSHVSARTRSIRLGTSVLLAPLHHPLRLAEETASLAVLSGGRFDLGISAGASSRYAEAFGIDPERRRADTEAVLGALRDLWAGRTVDVRTSAHSATRAALPLVPPSPPAVYWGAQSEESIRLAARAGFPLIQHLLQPPSMLADARDVYRGTNAAAGVSLLPASPVSRFAFIAETDAEARRAAREPAIALTAQLHEIGIDARGITTPEALAPQRFIGETAIVGSPETVIGRLRELAALLQTGLFNLNLGWFGHVPPAHVERSLHLLTHQILPAARP